MFRQMWNCLKCQQFGLFKKYVWKILADFNLEVHKGGQSAKKVKLNLPHNLWYR